MAENMNSKEGQQPNFKADTCTSDETKKEDNDFKADTCTSDETKKEDNDPPTEEETMESIEEFLKWYQNTNDFKKFFDAEWPEDDADNDAQVEAQHDQD